MRIRLLVALLAVVALPALADDPPAPAGCKLVKTAEWPIRFVGGLPVTLGAINGKKVSVLIDTGAYASLLTNSAADRLELGSRLTEDLMSGIGGLSRVRLARIDELRIGDTVVKSSMRVRVGGERPIPGVDLILGDDVFRNTDMEFDYARGAVRLFEPMDCKGASLAYWDADAQQLPMDGPYKIVIAVRVNGRETYAVVDSGASSSVVDLALASRVGNKPGKPGVVPAECHSGIGASLVHSWVAKFDTVAIGGETVRDPQLGIADFASALGARYGSPEMILGTDFLRAHRVFVSHSQRKIYFSYTGGLVFPATPSIDCDERLTGKTLREGIATYDRALAKNPNDAKALLNRAVLLIRDKDPDGALVDLDALIRIEPNNAVALSTRSGVRALRKDYAGAFADSDAAIANGMRTAAVYFYRAGLRGEQGDLKGADEEFNEALRLDPHHVGALRGQAYLAFDTQRFDVAEKDLSTLLAMRPDGFDSLWLQFSRLRQGHDGGRALEEGLAGLKEDEWPAPVLLYLLGRLDREGLMTTARADEKQRNARECEARFYMAERFIVEGKRDDARPLLEKARDECPKNYVEYEGALAELALP